MKTNSSKNLYLIAIIVICSKELLSKDLATFELITPGKFNLNHKYLTENTSKQIPFPNDNLSVKGYSEM